MQRSAALCSHAIDIANPSGVAHIAAIVADTNHVAGGADIGTGARSYRRIAVTGCIAI